METSEEDREKRACELGLENPSWEEIHACEESLKKRARAVGLPEGATRAEISACEMEEVRQGHIQTLGLPQTATWEEIIPALQEHSRKEAALKVGLPDTASWKEIDKLTYPNGHPLRHHGSSCLESWL